MSERIISRIPERDELHRRAGASGIKCQVCGDPLCHCRCMWNRSAERPDYLHEPQCESVTLRGSPRLPPARQPRTRSLRASL
jgi:hypothetical protein